MNGRFIPTPLTARERQVAALIGLGLTNRQIGLKLSISERTAAVHVQNILNKLGANNRAQIATWSAQSLRQPDLSGGGGRGQGITVDTTGSAAVAVLEGSPRKRVGRTVALLAAGTVAIVVITADDGAGPSPPFGALSSTSRQLVFQAKLAGDGEGFSVPYVIGDPNASAIRFVKGAVEYAVLKPGGDTGNRLAIAPLRRYLAEVELSVDPASNVEFWFQLGTAGPSQHIGDHLIAVETAAEELQLAYLVQNQGMEYVGPQVSITGLQLGRRFTISALVDPPYYQIYLNGMTVIKAKHSPSATYQAPAFAIFGDATGTVRLSAISVYSVT